MDSKEKMEPGYSEQVKIPEGQKISADLLFRILFLNCRDWNPEVAFGGFKDALDSLRENKICLSEKKSKGTIVEEAITQLSEMQKSHDGHTAISWSAKYKTEKQIKKLQEQGLSILISQYREFAFYVFYMSKFYIQSGQTDYFGQIPQMQQAGLNALNNLMVLDDIRDVDLVEVY